ncbi:MAG TPA: hypothetical protein VHD55_01825 [Candidatus Paceibacterota bacterium]|nr:hypothetical protein [Candidatus Paceibacterota bacterium]
MKNISKTGIVSVLAAAAFVIGPFSAFALTVDSAGAASADTSVSGSANGSGSNTTGTAAGNATVDVGVSGSASGNTTGATGTDTDTSGSGNASGSTGATLDTNANGVAISSSGQVSSDADLEVFSSNAEKMDANVKDVEASSDNEIKVAYAHAGRLFGFIPVKVTSETDVSVDASGNTNIHTRMPWWNMFVTRTHQVSNDVDTYLSASLTGSMKLSADASAAERARIIESIIRAHSSLEADASAQASGTAQY